MRSILVARGAHHAWAACLVAALAACRSDADSGPTAADAALAGASQDDVVRVGFDDVAAGGLPDDFVVAGTNQQGPLASWEVQPDEMAPTRPNVLRLTAPNHASGGTFNLCWNRELQFGDGSVAVRFRADDGVIDQGGGLVWRVRDADNYYIARMNPLESNYRLYVVKDGRRRQLASADVEIAAGEWHELSIRQEGDEIECFLDGTPRLQATDATFPDAGGVGFWTKADAATSFDDLIVEPERAE